MHENYNVQLRKKILTTAITTSLGIAVSSIPGIAISDVYTWGALTGPSNDPATCATSPDAAAVTFTILDASGNPLANSSIPAGDAKTGFNNQLQTPTCGTLTYDTTSGAGSAEFVSFQFFGGNPTLPATALGVTLDKLSSAEGNGSDTLLLANMLFNWNTNSGIPVSTVWDAQGLLAEMDGAPSTFNLNADGTINGTAATLTGTGGIPATDGLYVGTTIPGTGTGPGGFPGYLALGPSPIATTAYNTTPDCTTAVDCMGDAISGVLPLIVDTDASPDYSQNTGGGTTAGFYGNGSSPMLDGPFKDSYANFDYTSMKLVSFTDTTIPIATLVGSSTVDLIVGDPAYTGGSATCVDAPPLDAFTPPAALDAASAALVPISTASPSTTVLTYECTDGSGNVGTVSRTVNVKAPDALITLKKDANDDISPVTHECAVPYGDAGATCTDPEDGVIIGAADPLPNNLFSLDQSNIDANIGTIGGPFTATWSCQDNDLNTSTQDRDINVVDTTSPVLTLLDTSGDNIESSTAQNPVSAYTDPGASVTEFCDSTLPATIFSVATVDVVVPDTGSVTLPYSLPYTTTDASGNIGTVTRTVNVTRAQPVITLNGGGEVLNIGDTYTEQGMNIADAQDLSTGDLTNVTVSGSDASGLSYTINGTVDTSTDGEYTLTYDVTDSDGNLATQLSRTIKVGVFASGSNFSMLDANGNVFGGTNDVAFDWDGTTFNTDEADTNFDVMKIETVTPQKFFSFVWIAHNIRVFENTGTEPRTLTFDTTCTVAQLEAGLGGPGADCNGPLDPGQTQRYMTMTIAPGQIGAHILFDWNTSSDIDVLNVWDKDGVWDRHGGTGQTNKLWDGPAGDAPDETTTWKLVSTDFDGDNVNASPMIDGPFQGSNANFNAGPGASLPPPDPYTGTAIDTKLGSGLAMNVWGILAGLISLLAFRRFNIKNNK